MNTSLQTLDIHLPINSLDAYISYVNRIPMLSQDEEHRLAVELKQQNDLGAARQLVLAHTKYVVRVAKSYMGYGLPLADLIRLQHLPPIRSFRNHFEIFFQIQKLA